MRVVALVEFLARMKPSEAYLYEWLVGAKRVSDDAVARRVFPVYRRARRPRSRSAPPPRGAAPRCALRLAALGRVSCRALLLLARGVAAMQAVEVAFALGAAGGRSRPGARARAPRARRARAPERVS